VDKSARNDAIGAVLILLVTGLFASVTGEIYVDPLDPGFSSVDFPIMVLSLLTVLSLMLLARALSSLARTGWVLYERGEIEPILRYVAPLVLIGFAYVWCIAMFQYPLPTLIATIVSLAMFGNRGWDRLIVVPLSSTLIYYILFYALLGLHESPGTVWEYETQWFIRPIRDFLGLF
jgi:hypothetical protein